MKDYQTVSLEQTDQVLTVTFLSRPRSPGANGHWELGSLFSELREENSVRVIVLTGSGGHFKIPPPKSYFRREETEARRRNPADMWLTFTGLIRCHQAMAEIEKPIVAKVNGDAIGFGQSLAFASDLIIAREDAIFMDHHMAGTFLADYDGELLPGGPENSQIPGDGGAALVPLFMSPISRIARSQRWVNVSRQAYRSRAETRRS